MSQFVTEAFAQAFGENFLHVAQQKTSRFLKAVTIEGNIKGVSKSINRLGQRTAQRRLTRHGDTPIYDQGHSTRYVDLFDWEDGDMVDDQDKIRMLPDPKSDYVAALVASLNRAEDDVIIAAINGTARTASGTQALTSGQIIVNGATALNKAKILQTRQLFRINEADSFSGEELYWAYGAQQMNNIMSDTSLTSSDFLAVQMLQEGKVATNWLGFTWIPSERLPKTGTIRSNLAWAKSGIVFGMGENIMTRVGEDPGKGFNTRIYAKMSVGAVRVEEEKVVRIDCVEI